MDVHPGLRPNVHPQPVPPTESVVARAISHAIPAISLYLQLSRLDQGCPRWWARHSSPSALLPNTCCIHGRKASGARHRHQEGVRSHQASGARHRHLSGGGLNPRSHQAADGPRWVAGSLSGSGLTPRSHQAAVGPRNPPALLPSTFFQEALDITSEICPIPIRPW